MDRLEEIKSRLATSLPDAVVELVSNPAVPLQSSLRVDVLHAVAVAQFLRDTPDLRFDLCSNVTGVDWPDRDEKVKVRRTVDGAEKEVEEARRHPGYLEAVYHLYSVALRHGPLVLRQRTADRARHARLTSLTPVWRSCEFQEREIFDLFGIHFEGHPDQRRILMWDGFEDHPMRKDYVAPDDYEYEPTPHGDVLEKVRERQPNPGAEAGA